MKTIAAFFDIDGTIHRNSLLIEHFKKMIKYEIIPKELYSGELENSYLAWYNRKGNHETYLMNVSGLYQNSIKGLKEEDVLFAVDKVMKLEAEKVYTYTRDRIKWHLDKGHIVIFISGSPDFLVSEMAKKYNVTDYAGSKYLVKNAVFTGEVVPMWDSNSKNNKLNEMVDKYNIDLSNSYAYGDTNGDLAMLKKVGNPIAINPNKELLTNLSNSDISKKLKIVVERKDVVYVLDRNLAYIL